MVEYIEKEEVARQGVSSRPRKTRWLWAAGGFVSFGLAMIGVVIPILPTTPFVLLAAFCFARSSDRLNAWFKSTKVYQKVLEGYMKKREMTVKVKLSIIIPVTLLLGIACYLMRHVTPMVIVLAIVWLAHLIYFGFVVKTDRGSNEF